MAIRKIFQKQAAEETSSGIIVPVTTTVTIEEHFVKEHIKDERYAVVDSAGREIRVYNTKDGHKDPHELATEYAFKLSKKEKITKVIANIDIPDGSVIKK